MQELNNQELININGGIPYQIIIECALVAITLYVDALEKCYEMGKD